MSMLDAVGGARLVPLGSMVPSTSARILVQPDHENPTGRMKDRMARAMIETAKRLAGAGLVAGTPTGGHVAVALRVAERLGAGRTVVTLTADSCMKSLGGALHARA